MRRPARTAMYAMTFCSGLAALIYEVVWARMLALAFGATTLSVAAVVAGFMGGMGLGAWLYHRYGGSRPLLNYAILEFAIALSASMLSLAFNNLPPALAQLSGVIGSTFLYELLRFVAVFAGLLVPAMLMGATYPALCAVFIRNAPAVDRHLGVVYGMNTAGAALGALAAGLWLIDWLGLQGAARMAIFINLLVGLSALLFWRPLSADGSPTGDETGIAVSADTGIATDLPARVTGVVLFVSGFCTLAYEILWFRALRYTMGTSSYVFSVVLCTFLVGLALGAFLLRHATRRQQPEHDLASCQILIAIFSLAALAAFALLPEVPDLFEQLSFRSAIVKSQPWSGRLAIDGGLAVITMLPATLFMGLSFPLATRLFIGDVRQLEKRVGSAYVLANIGSIAGAIAAAALLLPYLGTLGGTKLCALFNVALAALILFAMRHKPPVAWRFATMGVVVVGVMAVALPSKVPLRGEMLDDEVTGDVVFSEEGNLATVQVLEDPRDTSRRAIAINGIKIGWSEGFRGTANYRKQVLLAHLPMVLDGNLRQSLTVGLGSAATVRSLASYPQMESVECVEINNAVARACGFFPECAVFNDPRVHLTVDDALHFLLGKGREYDLIVSDGKQDQLNSGNATMLCREYYTYVRERLTESGMMVQWLQLGMLHADFRIVLRTACSVFDEVDVFFFPPASVLWIGSQLPLADRRRLSREEYAASAAPELAPYYLLSSAAVIGHWVAGKEQLIPLLGDGPVSTWDRLILDSSPFRANPKQWQNASAANLDLLVRASGTLSPQSDLLSDTGERAFAASQRFLRRAILEAPRNPARARRLARNALRANGADGEVRQFLSGLGQ